jgi:hypothetical protein
MKHKNFTHVRACADDASKYGDVVVNMWKEVSQHTTEARFGAALRKLLLSGTVRRAASQIAMSWLRVHISREATCSFGQPCNACPDFEPRLQACKLSTLPRNLPVFGMWSNIRDMVLPVFRVLSAAALIRPQTRT